MEGRHDAIIVVVQPTNLSQWSKCMSEVRNGTEPAERDSPDRLTLRLSPEARKALEEISAARGGVSFAEVVRRALGTEQFLISEQREGSRILVERPDKSIRQIVLR
jgi:hypothetical protein